MPRKIAYWASTAIVAVALLGSLTYLTGSEQVLLALLLASYLTRPAGRRLALSGAAA